MSKIIVDSIEPRPGINTITINAVNIDSSSSFVVTGIITASSFSGSASGLTNIPSGQLSGALPAIDGSSLTGIAGVPSGSVFYFPANSLPSGFLKANGATISRTTYADLFAVIGTQYGAGDGSTTFQLPDLRGEFIRGWDDSRGVDSGRTFGSAQSDAITDHTHKVRSEGESSGDGSNLRNTDSDNNAPTRSDGFNNRVTGVDALINGSNTTITTETRPRNVALLACIKY